MKKYKLIWRFSRTENNKDFTDYIESEITDITELRSKALSYLANAYNWPYFDINIFPIDEIKCITL